MIDISISVAFNINYEIYNKMGIHSDLVEIREKKIIKNLKIAMGYGKFSVVNM